MIKIQFDHQAFTMQRFGGISRYFANIQKHLNRYDAFGYDRGILFTSNYYLKDEKFPAPNLYWKTRRKREKKSHKLNKEFSAYSLKKNDYQIFHPTYFDPYFLDLVKTPFVLTVHDLIYELFPEYFPNTDDTVYHKRLLIEKAAHIIAISASTRNDLQEIYQVPDHKISLIYHGFDAVTAQPDELTNARFENYILFVGDRWSYKNFFKWLQAVAPLLIKYHINAVCAGGKAFTTAETEFIKRLKIENRIQQLQATETELAGLYQHALMFVYPSLYEGFGFPILEAFANNCPVAVSNTSCFAEVGGNAAVYFDPYSVPAMQTVMENLLLSPDAVKNNMRVMGQAQLAKFPMESCMEQTVNVYRSLVQ